MPVVTCEYGIDPPNPASKRLDWAFGILEFGRQSVADGKKLVSLSVAQVGVTGIIPIGQSKINHDLSWKIKLSKKR